MSKKIIAQPERLKPKMVRLQRMSTAELEQFISETEQWGETHGRKRHSYLLALNERSERQWRKDFEARFLTKNAKSVSSKNERRRTLQSLP